VLNASSAFGIYLVITKGAGQRITEFVMIARVVAIAICDLGCAAVLMFKGMSLKKHIDLSASELLLSESWRRPTSD